MSTITTIASSDLITTSRITINTNFSNLNTDKIETSVLDTDTTLSANSDAKVATQKATKAYADSVVGANASETVKGVVEEATDAEVTAGTATGSTGAKLIVTPAKLATRLTTVLASYQPTMVFKNGATTYDTATASGTQNIAHGIGAVPKKVKITGTYAGAGATCISITAYNGTTQSSNYMITETGSGTSEFAGALFLFGEQNSSNNAQGVVTFDATNIIITWTKTGSPTGTAYLIWEAEY